MPNKLDISLTKAWNRTCRKCNEPEDQSLSPIKPIAVTLQSVYFKNDQYLDGFIWVLSMSEQFYYDNVLLMLSQCKNDGDLIKKAIITNYSRIPFSQYIDRWINVSVLGEGCYGKVFRVEDNIANEDRAVKFITRAYNKLMYKNNMEMLNYLKERNYLIRAGNSPYVMQFHFAIKSEKLQGLFMVFEYCPRTLEHYLTALQGKCVKNPLHALFGMVDISLKEIYDDMLSEFDCNVLQINTIFIFECLAALFYLAKCNIVHGDIKPDNILLSTTGHIKLGDFGLTRNTHFITKATQSMTANVNLLVKHENNFGINSGGAPAFRDMELLYTNGIMKGRMMDLLHVNIDEYNPTLYNNYLTFLSDLWAMGIVIGGIMFLGHIIFFIDSKDVPLKNAIGVPHNSWLQYVMDITLVKKNYNRIFRKMIVNFSREVFGEFADLFISIFQPRPIRCAKYVASTKVRILKEFVEERYIDIEKVENISIFKENELTRSNAFLFHMDTTFMKYIRGPKFVKYDTFHELMEELESKQKETDTQHFPLNPGTEISFI